VITVTGHPKSGTNALALAVELLGLPVHRQHIEYGVRKADIAVIRNPKDMLVSWVRMCKKPVTEGTLIAAMRSFDGRPYKESLAAYIGWRPIAVRYESLIASDAEMRNIANRFGVKYIKNAWEDLLRSDTPTKNSTQSYWRDYETPLLVEAWGDLVGGNTLAEWGYK